MTDKSSGSWEALAQRDPYWAVLSSDRFRNRRALEEFFATGLAHVEGLRQRIRDDLRRDFHPTRALDFGCGVGRVLIPLARLCETIVGADVSPTMLALALQHCQDKDVTNAEFTCLLDDRLASLGTFDFIHSFLVLQHIPVRRGESLIRGLLELLRPGGVAAFHLTYAREVKFAALRRALLIAQRHVPVLHQVVNVLRGRALAQPLMEMNRYSLSRVFRLVRDVGVRDCHVQLVRDGTYYGAFLLFEKPQ